MYVYAYMYVYMYVYIRTYILRIYNFHNIKHSINCYSNSIQFLFTQHYDHLEKQMCICKFMYVCMYVCMYGCSCYSSEKDIVYVVIVITSLYVNTPSSLRFLPCTMTAERKTNGKS